MPIDRGESVAPMLARARLLQYCHPATRHIDVAFARYILILCKRALSSSTCPAHSVGNMGITVCCDDTPCPLPPAPSAATADTEGKSLGFSDDLRRAVEDAACVDGFFTRPAVSLMALSCRNS